MGNVMLSLVLPVYNVEKYIDSCLESIFRQSLENCEVILVDDGTPDSSGAICDRYKKKFDNVKVFHNQNMGSYKTRLFGAQNASGMYIWFIDSDDWILDNSVEKLLHHIKENNYPDVVIFDYLVNGKSKPSLKADWSKKSFSNDEKVEPINKLLESDAINAIWRKCIKRELIVNNEFLDDLRGFSFGEDAYISAGVFELMKSLTILDEALYAYRINMSSMTHSYNLQRLDNQRVLYERLHTLAEHQKTEDKVSKKLDNRIIAAFLGDICCLFESKLPWNDKMGILEKKLADEYWNKYFVVCNSARLDANSYRMWKILNRSERSKERGLKGYYLKKYISQKIKRILRKYRRL